MQVTKRSLDNQIIDYQRKGILVYLSTINWKRNKDPDIPLSLAYIESYCISKSEELSKRNFIVRTFNHTVPIEHICKDILHYNPLILGFGVYTWNVEQIKQIIKNLRNKGFRGVVVLGGPEVTYNSEELFEIDHLVDFYVKGAGEEAMLQIIHSVLHRTQIQIKGIVHALQNSPSELTDGNIFKYAIPPLISSTFNSRYVGKEFARIQTQRGCPYNCTYCSHSTGYRKCVYRPLTTLQKEFAMLKKYNVKTVAVIDPVFFLNKKHSMKVLEIKEQIIPEVRFELQTRPDIIDRTLIYSLEGMNIKLEFGIQSLDFKVMKAINRHYDTSLVLNNLDLVSELGIAFETNLIYGLPYQTYESHINDREILLNFRTNHTLRCFQLQLLKGTILDKQMKSIFKGKMFFKEKFPYTVIETAWLSKEEIEKLTQSILINQGKLHA